MHEATNLRNKSVQKTLCSESRISSTSGKKLQETRLPQTDRTARRTVIIVHCSLFRHEPVRRNPVNCCKTIGLGKTCTTKSTKRRSSGVRALRPTVCVQSRRVDRRKRSQQARPSTSFVDNTIDLPWQNFPSPGVRNNFQKKVP